MTTTTSRTSSDLVQISRAEQRKQRLRELESEQAAEEAEALKMTEVNLPFQCFTLCFFPILIMSYFKLFRNNDRHF